MDSSPVLRSFEALMREDHEVAEAFLIAAVYTVALRDDTSPRDIADRIFKAMPSSENWGALRSALLHLLEESAGGA